MAELTPFALKDAPALIEAVFPAQKVSFEAQKERKANLGQTLTGLGSYWKGRKPLILVRAVVLGSLLPQTDNPEKDLEVFELLMAFDDQSLAKRALIQNLIKPKDIAEKINLHNPWDYFSHNIKADDDCFAETDALAFPLNPDSLGLKLRWRRDIEEKDKLNLLTLFLGQIEGYEEKSLLCKRPEEVEQEWLYEHVWSKVNQHYNEFGVNASSLHEFIEQIGILKYGHRPRVADTFSGGGSIPFEAARVGCDAIASDLNPVACMLSWGALNVMGASPKKRQEYSLAQEFVSKKVDDAITDLQIEHDADGNRTKSYLYCLEVTCPESGWRVPISPSWVISKNKGVIAKLRPNYESQTFDIDVVSGCAKAELKDAEKGTIQNGNLTYILDGREYRNPLKTIRGDHKDPKGKWANNLRKWSKSDFKYTGEDIYRERLYAIHWIQKESLDSTRQTTFFRAVTEEDLLREEKVDGIVRENLSKWQQQGLVPDMEIESGDKTDEPIRTRGWTHWHHLFNSRQILIQKLINQYSLESSEPACMTLYAAKVADWNNKCCHWHTGWDKPENLFYNQALDPFINYGSRSSYFLLSQWGLGNARYTDLSDTNYKVVTREAKDPLSADLFITDPPYADAVMYHEITEFFIAWFRKNPPKPFDEWTWDSRRALAVKGSGDDFRKGMAESYSAMTKRMPDNGMQCVMFTHQDTGVWSDMIGIFWAAGLQVVGAWYIATETSTELKKGGYVQGTVILMLRKRPAGENSGFKQRLLPAVRAEVKNQIETMMHLNDEVKDKMGEPVFNDSDLQMAGYAAALKVLTSYTHIGGEDVTTFALRPRTKGEITVVDEIVQQAAEAANSLLVPEGLSTDTWQKLSGIQRFYLRMMDIETTGAAKLDNYQNFAKAFRVEDYSRVMGCMAANKAQLKRIPEFASRDLTESNEIGSTWLGHLIIGLQQLLAETDPQAVISQLQADLPDFMEIRALLIDVLTFVENKAPEKETRDVAEVLGARLKNMRALGN